jgi:hypothetical protein
MWSIQYYIRVCLSLNLLNLFNKVRTVLLLNQYPLHHRFIKFSFGFIVVYFDFRFYANIMTKADWSEWLMTKVDWSEWLITKAGRFEWLISMHLNVFNYNMLNGNRIERNNMLSYIGQKKWFKGVILFIGIKLSGERTVHI